MENEQIGGVDVTMWSEEQKAALRSALMEVAAADFALSTVEVAREAAASSPEAIVRDQLEAAAATKRRAERLVELEKAEKKFGKKRVILIPLEDGSGIVLRGMTLAETDAAEVSAANLPNPQERTIVHRRALLDTVEFPARGEVEKKVSERPGLWGVLYAGRDLLIVGLDEEHRGKATPSITKPAAR